MPEISKSIKNILRFVSYILIAVSLFLYATFILTYERVYGIESLSFYSLKIFIVCAVMWMSIFGLVLLSSGIFLYYKNKPEQKILYQTSIPILIAYFIMILFGGYFACREDNIIDPNWFLFFLVSVVFSASIGAVYAKYIETKNKNLILHATILIFIMHMIIIWLFPQIYAKAFEVFFVSKKIVATNIEIYLEQKNIWLDGRLILRDSEIAHVDFYENNTVKRKIVNIKDIVILPEPENKLSRLMDSTR